MLRVLSPLAYNIPYVHILTAPPRQYIILQKKLITAPPTKIRKPLLIFLQKQIDHHPPID
jgi:hypothetical protein